MKRVISLALAVMMILSLTVIFASAHKANDCLGTIPMAKATPTIDGVKDAAYDTSLRIAIDAPLNAIYNPIGGDGATGIAYLMASPDYTKLYVYALVTDKDMDFNGRTDTSITEEVTDNSAWMHDSVEIFIDPTNEHSVDITIDDDGYPVYNAEQRNSGLYQYRMELNNTKTSWANGATTSEALNSTFEAARKVVGATTYSVEFAIDLTSLSTTSGVNICQKGANIGFQMMINDKISTSTLLNNTVNSDLEGDCPLNFYGGTKANSPCVWASQDWLYVTMGDADTQAGGVDDRYKGIDTTTNAVGTVDTIAVAAGILVLAAAGAVVMTKKRR